MRIIIILLVLFLASCQPSKDQAQKALDDAKRFTQNGEYEKALERHVWFHNNALKIRPSYYGVRLSFALGYWVELGEKYPKALEKLKSIRDEKTSRLIAGEYNRELFHDVGSINDNLREIVKTVELFEYFHKKNPQFAESVFDIANDSLFINKQYSLARKYLGNPKERLDIAKQYYEKGFQRYTRNNDKELPKAYETIFVDEIIRLITILDKSGEQKIATEIQTEALKVLDSPEIRNSVTIKNTE